MTDRRRFIAAGTAALAAGPAFVRNARAQQAWPQKPVTMVVPYATGGTSDLLGRLVAVQLGEAFKQSFVVENQGGAAGSIGSLRVARSAPDGYTLLVADIGSHIVAPLMFGQRNFDPMNDFTHIAMLGGSPFVLAVHPSSPVRDVKSFIEYVRAQPKGSSWSSPGLGSRGHLLGEVLKADENLNMVHIVYKGAGPAVTDLLGGQVPAGFVTLSAMASSLKAGKLRGIGITSEQRLPGYPDLPTFKEQGFPKITALAAFMLSGPAKLPRDIVNRLNAGVRKAIDSPDMQAKYTNAGLVADNMSPEELEKFLIAEREFYRPIVERIVAEEKASARSR